MYRKEKLSLLHGHYYLLFSVQPTYLLLIPEFSTRILSDFLTKLTRRQVLLDQCTYPTAVTITSLISMCQSLWHGYCHSWIQCPSFPLLDSSIKAEYLLLMTKSAAILCYSLFVSIELWRKPYKYISNFPIFRSTIEIPSNQSVCHLLQQFTKR